MGNIKAFPFWRKQYLFHPKATSNVTLLKLYHPYNSLAKLNWRFWKYSSIYQKIFTFNLNKNSKLYQIINSFIDKNPDYVWAINVGTKSIYQKTTGLFISDKKEHHKDFFFKWADSKLALEFIKNEITVNQEIKNYSFAPKMTHFEINDTEAFYLSEIIHGTKYKALDVNGDVIQLISEIQSIKIENVVKYSLSDTTIASFNHGDFCPWNLIQEDHTGIIKVIDWEFSGLYPKGFDLLYYIFSVEFQIKKHTIPENIVNENYSIINNYYKSYGIEDWKPYLKEFAEICNKRFTNTKTGAGFLKLLNYCNLNH